MSKNQLSLLWITAVIIVSTLLLSRLNMDEPSQAPDGEPVQKTAKVMMIAYDDSPWLTEGPGRIGSGSLTFIGCHDALVPMDIPVVSSRIDSILHALSTFDPPEGLHNPVKEKNLQLVVVRHINRTKTVVNVTGELMLGGVCDTPRLKSQIEETLRTHADAYEIQLNGSQAAYKCIGDLRGQCS